MSEDDIRRIADAIEMIAGNTRKKDPFDLIANMHDDYAGAIEEILDGPNDAFETFKKLRALVSQGRQYAHQLREQNN